MAQRRNAKPGVTIAGTYPFSEAAAITIISYPDRRYWDNHFPQGVQYAIDSGLLDEPGLVQELHTLSKAETAKIFAALYQYDKCDGRVTYGCCDPSQLILFYNGEHKIFAWIELCLSCLNTMTSSNKIPEIRFCRKKWSS